MEDNLSDAKPGMGGDASATAATPASADPATPTAPDQRASPAPSSASSSARRPYVPQFSAATQMILSRISSKPGSLSAALSSASSVARSIEKSTFEDAKRRLVMNMNTSLTMPIPPLPPRRTTASSSRALTMPMGDAFQLRTPAPISTPIAAKPPPVKAAISKSTPPKPKGKAARGTKRKRGKDDEDASSSLSELSDSDVDAAAASKKAATKTKSGRQVQKPTQFNPTDAPGSQKRKNYGKRTAEQALCKVCTRGLSPIANQIVFCDGCNNCWHQLCHNPYIDDEFVTDENRSWFCSSCATKREKALAKKKTLVEHKGISWASKTPAQVTRASTVPAVSYRNANRMYRNEHISPTSRMLNWSTSSCTAQSYIQTSPSSPARNRRRLPNGERKDCSEAPLPILHLPSLMLELLGLRTSIIQSPFRIPKCPITQAQSQVRNGRAPPRHNRAKQSVNRRLIQSPPPGQKLDRVFWPVWI